MKLTHEIQILYSQQCSCSPHIPYLTLEDGRSPGCLKVVQRWLGLREVVRNFDTPVSEVGYQLPSHSHRC